MNLIDSISVQSSDSLSVSEKDTISLFEKNQDIIIEIPVRKEGIRIPNEPKTESWVLVAFIFLFLGICFSLRNHFRLFISAMNSFFSSRAHNSIFSDSMLIDIPTRIITIIISSVCFGFFISLAATSYIDVPFHKSVIILSLCCFSFFLLNKLLIKLSGYIFWNRIQTNLAEQSYHTLITYGGIFLFPIVLCMIYAPANYFYIFQYAGFIWLVTLFILKIYRSILIFSYRLGVLLYIILYLCALKILSIASFFKLIFNII